MIGFPIITLHSQLSLINNYIEVHDLSRKDILIWLAHYGRVNKSDRQEGNTHYVFFSNFGFDDAFYFVEQNKIAMLPVR
jgi:hypothetical protein